MPQFEGSGVLGELEQVVQCLVVDLAVAELAVALHKKFPGVWWSWNR